MSKCAVARWNPRGLRLRADPVGSPASLFQKELGVEMSTPFAKDWSLDGKLIVYVELLAVSLSRLSFSMCSRS
jgi:hypothetical protein